MRSVNPDSKGLLGDLIRFFVSELKPRGKLFTPFNIISVPIVLVGIVYVLIRFAYGLGSMTNLTQEFPWGIWIGFDVVTGVAFAGGAYVVTTMVYIFHMKKYHAIVRATVLNGFLAYCFYAGALLLDLGRPWNIINPIIGNKFGVNSVLFLVSWHFMLYMATEALEFSPAVAEWLNLPKLRKVLAGLTMGAVIFGVCLSFLHQSGLGALFLLAKGKIHPLWYSEFIPILFLVSSIFAGLSMVILEGSISHKVFGFQISEEDKKKHDDILLGLSKAAAGSMFVYLGMQGIVIIHGEHFSLLSTGWGLWYLLENLGLVLVPMFLFLWAIKNHSVVAVRAAALLTALGVILNRLNVSVIAYKWYSPHHYYPSVGEIIVTLTVISVEIWIFRWIILRMPVLHEEPAFQHKETLSKAAVPAEAK